MTSKTTQKARDSKSRKFRERSRTDFVGTEEETIQAQVISSQK